MAVEAPPTPTFKTENTPSKTQMREKIPVIRTLAEKSKQRGEKRAERAARPKYQESTLQSIRQKHEAGTRPIALNLGEDKRFKNMVEAEETALLQGRGQNVTELTGATALTPSEKAKAKADAYVKYAAQYEGSAKQYAADGFHFAKNKDGTYSIDPGQDLFYITVKQDAQEARLTGGEAAAQAVYDKFATQYPNKAGIYASHGEQALKDSLARGTATPDANVGVAGASTSVDMNQTRNSVEQKAQATRSELDRMSALAKRGESNLRAKELNELKQLRLKHANGISEAQRLDQMLRVPNGPPLSDKDLASLEPYEDYLQAQDADNKVAVQQAAAVGTAPTPDAQTVANQAKLEQVIRTQGVQIIGELKARGVDISTMSEQVAIERLRDKLIINPDGSEWKDDPNTRAYIHEAFVEQQKLQAEAIMARLAPADVAALEKKHKGDTAGLLLALAALVVGSLAPEVRASMH